ncbi:hypothetical protein GCM10027612_69080 [Microbispora bryophytorum subsp. camponoti]
MRVNRLALAAVAILTAALSTACSGGAEEPSEQAASQSAAPAGPVKLTYWTWVPNMDKIVAVWNQSHPDIQVTVSKQAGATTPRPSSSPPPRRATRPTWSRPSIRCSPPSSPPTRSPI